jgi:hypothetical protein
MKIRKKLIYDSAQRRAWSIHEGREHVGFIEAAPTGYSARRADGKQMKQIVPTSQLACAWLLAKRLGIENESGTTGRTVVRVRTVQGQQAGGDSRHQARGVVVAARTA